MGATIDAGTLKAGSGGGLANPSVTIGASGTLDLNASNVTIGSLSGSGNITDDSTQAGTSTLSIYQTGRGTTTTYSGDISDGENGRQVALAATLGTAATFTLSGDNTYSGTTTVSDGTLVIAGTGSLPGDIYIVGSGSGDSGSGGRSGTLTFSGTGSLNGNIFIGCGYSGTGAGVFQVTGTGSVDGDISNDGVVTFSSSSNQSYSGVISGSGTVTKSGSGTLTLAGANTYTGDTTISGGTLVVGNSDALSGSTLDYDNYGGSLSFATSVTTATFGGLQGGQDLPLTNAEDDDVALTVGGNDTDTTYAGILSGGGSLTKAGTGTLTLSGANTYSGDTTVGGGTLEAMTADSLPGYGTEGQLTVASGATIAVSADNWSSDDIGLLLANNLSSSYGNLGIDVSDGNDFEYSTDIGGNIGLVKLGDGMLTLAGTNSYSGDTIISDGTLIVGDVEAIPNGAGMGNVEVDGTLDLGGLSITVNGLSGSGTVTSESTENATLTVGGNDQTSEFDGAIQDGSSSGTVALAKIGSGTLTLTGPNAFSGDTTIGGGTLSFDTGTLDSTASIVFEGGSLQWYGSNTEDISALIAPIDSGESAILDTNGNDVTFNTALAGDGGLTKIGDGTLTLTPTTADTYLGPTALQGGTLELGLNAQAAVLQDGGADIQSGSMLFDYTSSSNDPASTIQAQLTGSYDGGAWDAGQFRNSTAAATGLTLGWLDNAATEQVTIMATQPGDFNLDGVVDETDRDIWLTNVGRVNATWQEGDANYDGMVDGLDYDLWFSSGGNPGSSAPVVMLIAPISAAPSDAHSAQFIVAFSRPVTGVTADDFELDCAAGTSGTIASVDAYSPSGSVYLVTVDNVSVSDDEGTVGLNLKYDAGIEDSNESSLQTTGFQTLGDEQVFAGQTAPVQKEVDWNGASTTSNSWRDPNNWVGGVAPSSSDNDNVLFERTTSTTKRAPILLARRSARLKLLPMALTLPGKAALH